jgi:hypothetical protein
LTVLLLGFYCSPDIQMAHFGLTILILCAGMAAPWVDYKINGFAVRPFLLASLVFIGVIPFGQWLYITPDVYRNEVTKVSDGECIVCLLVTVGAVTKRRGISSAHHVHACYL